MQEQVDLIAERLARVVDRLQDDLREIRALLRHQQELTECRLVWLETQAQDQEQRLRDAQTAAAQFRVFAGLTSGSSGLLSLLALLRSFFGG